LVWSPSPLPRLCRSSRWFPFYTVSPVYATSPNPADPPQICFMSEKEAHFFKTEDKSCTAIVCVGCDCKHSKD
jgi:hypothetical protein